MFCFARVRCSECVHDYFVAFSCKLRCIPDGERGLSKKQVAIPLNSKRSTVPRVGARSASAKLGVFTAPVPNGRMSLLDTHPNALQRQVELLRIATPAQRFAAVRSLSATVASLSRRALRRSMPNASQEEIDLTFVELHYGDAVAALLRRHPARRT